jgi:hypothetical protein
MKLAPYGLVLVGLSLSLVACGETMVRPSAQSPARLVSEQVQRSAPGPVRSVVP